MSAETWIKEFYPISAMKAVEIHKSDADLVRHCIAKWEGFRLENVKRHGVHIETRDLADEYDEVFLRFSTATCALCVKYRTGCWCSNCPLYKWLGHPCDRGVDSSKVEGLDGESLYWASLKHPELMVQTLTTVLAELEAK